MFTFKEITEAKKIEGIEDFERKEPNTNSALAKLHAINEAHWKLLARRRLAEIWLRDPEFEPDDALIEVLGL